MKDRNKLLLLNITATENAYLLNRMLNILTRNQIEVRQVRTYLIQEEGNYFLASFLVSIQPALIDKILKQMRRLVEVKHVNTEKI